MTTAFRATIMLSTLVGMPAAWIYYGPLPDSAQQIVDRLVAVAKEATGWRPKAQPAAPSWDYTKSAPLRTVEGRTSPGSAPVAAVAESAAAPFAPAVQQPLQSAGSPAGAGQPIAEAAEASAPTPLAERVKPLLDQLHRHGVVEYALERWGSDGNFYRFHCEMPLGGDGALTQQFEAVTADPEASVEQVVAEVSRWRLARQAGGM